MSIKPSVVVLDYGSGNVHSALKALEEAGAKVSLSAEPDQVFAADGLVVPGVGAFAAVMDALATVRGAELIERRLAGSRAVFGICVGMQIMFSHGVEGGRNTAGLGQWPGTITRLTAPVLPHMGWNTITVAEDSRLFTGLEQERFYFVHSFAATSWELEVFAPFVKPKVSYAEYGEKFVAAVENGSACASQFHPEKSGMAGIRLLKNWLDTL